MQTEILPNLNEYLGPWYDWVYSAESGFEEDPNDWAEIYAEDSLLDFMDQHIDERLSGWFHRHPDDKDSWITSIIDSIG